MIRAARGLRHAEQSAFWIIARIDAECRGKTTPQIGVVAKFGCAACHAEPESPCIKTGMTVFACHAAQFVILAASVAP